jgi:transglutaminase-like putative cysteine protease
MKKILCFALIILLIVPFAYSVSYDDKSTLEAIVTISNSFTITPTSASYNIKFINATLASYPRNDIRQIVTEMATEPQTVIGDSISFLYTDPTQDSYTLHLNAKVNTRNTVDEIKTSVVFPLNNLDSSLYIYLEPTKIIDVTPEIKNLASELIGDKTDLYEIEYAFAEYVRKNIAYDLGSLTSNVDQKSSWVLDNKRGVCDEITNLFISLNRAAGIPAKFVSGQSYTNLNDVFGSNWVSHAWAEIYFPGYGWIPYDVTYGQYGFIDAGHIKLMESEESSSSSVSYNYLGNNIKLNPEKINIDVTILNYGENVRGRYTFDASIYTSEVGFGSYNMISVNVENNKDYYQIADLYLGETEGVSIIEDSKETVLNKTIHRQQVLLKPRQSSTIYWIVKVSDDLDKNFVYTLPITVYNTYNETSTTFIASRKDYKSLDLDYFKEYIASKTAESVKAYSKYIYLECFSDKNSMYVEDSLNINCTLDNKGDKSFNSVDICLDDNCTTKNLAVQKIQLQYNKKFDSVGLKNVAIKAYHDEFTKVNYVPIQILDKPKISINDLKYPESVNYDESFDISFTLGKDSKSTPKNIKILLKSDTSKVEWVFSEFTEDKGFTIKSDGSTMRPNINNYNLLIQYEDENGKLYDVNKDFIIQSNATFLQKMALYFNLFAQSIEKVFTE